MERGLTRRPTLQRPWSNNWPRASCSTTSKPTSPTGWISSASKIAPDFGIAVAAGPRFGIGGAFERHLRLPYSLPTDQLDTAVRQLAAARQAISMDAAENTSPSRLREKPCDSRWEADRNEV